MAENTSPPVTIKYLNIELSFYIFNDQRRINANAVHGGFNEERGAAKTIGIFLDGGHFARSCKSGVVRTDVERITIFSLMMTNVIKKLFK